MMDCKEIETRLDDWFDGELADAAAADFQAHLDHCEACRSKVDSTRQLLLAAGGLAREMEPPRSLWPEIEARLRQEAAAPATAPAWPRALAAGLLVAGVFFAGMLADRMLHESEPQAELAAIERIPDGLGAAAARETLPAGQVELVSGIDFATNGEQTEDVMLRNLLVVNLAIRQLEAAVESEPDNAQLRRLLTSLYEQEQDLLRKAEVMNNQAGDRTRLGI